MLKLRGFTREIQTLQSRLQIIKEFEKNLLTQQKIVYNEIVAVKGNKKLRPFAHALCLSQAPVVECLRKTFTRGQLQAAFFISFMASVLHTKVVHLHGWLGRKHRHQDTPPVCRPALVKRLVKHLVHRW